MRISAFGCLTIFAVPFIGLGLGAIVVGVRALASGDATGDPEAPIVVGAVFVLMGAGMIALGMRGRRTHRRFERLRALHPDSPWRWREDWAAGRVTDASRIGLGVSWFFAIIWNLIAWTGAIAAVDRAEGGALIVAALFPVIGLGLLAWAIRVTLRYRAFGTSVLEFGETPGIIGRGFTGTVRLPKGLAPATQFEVVLRRLELKTTGSGKHRHTHESIRWEERAVRVARREARGIAVPVAFRIPASEEPTDSDPRANPRTVWRLELSAEVPGVDYLAQFEVPVFQIAGAEPLPTDDAPPLPPEPAPEEYRQPPESPIRVSSTARGTEILYPPARNPGVAAMTSGFALVWLGIVYALLRWDAPLLFPIVFGGFGVLILFIPLWLWFGVTRVQIVSDGAIVTRRLLGIGRPRSVPRSLIAAVEVRIGMQAGRTPYYDVRIVRKDGKTVPAGSGIPEKREAEWLAWIMERDLGLGADRPAEAHML